MGWDALDGLYWRKKGGGVLSLANVKPLVFDLLGHDICYGFLYSTKLWAFHSFIHQVTYRAIHPNLLYFIHLVTYRAIHPNLLYFIHPVTYRAIHPNLLYFIHHLFNCSVKLNYSFNVKNIVAEVPGVGRWNFQKTIWN